MEGRKREKTTQGGEEWKKNEKKYTGVGGGEKESLHKGDGNVLNILHLQKEKLLQGGSEKVLNYIQYRRWREETNEEEGVTEVKSS